MKKVVHLINALQVGGVEVGVLNLLNSSKDRDYHVVSVKGGDPELYEALTDRQKERVHLCNNYFSAFKVIYNLNLRCVVTSLWRGHLLGIIYSILVRGIYRVHFIHSSSHSHLIDKIVTLVSIMLCDEVFCDSQKSFQSFKSVVGKKKASIIPMNVSFSDGYSIVPRDELKFVYVGRFAKEKNIELSLHFIHGLVKSGLDVRFDLYGRDDGSLSILEKLVDRLALKSTVKFHEPLLPYLVEDVLCNYSYFIQTSRFEGMAISVYQALGCGLLPVVTPVGEIANYTEGGVNAFYIDHNNLDFSLSKFLDAYSNDQFSSYIVGPLSNDDNYRRFDINFFESIDLI